MGAVAVAALVALADVVVGGEEGHVRGHLLEALTFTRCQGVAGDNGPVVRVTKCQTIPGQAPPGFFRAGASTAAIGKKIVFMRRLCDILGLWCRMALMFAAFILFSVSLLEFKCYEDFPTGIFHHHKK